MAIGLRSLAGHRKLQVLVELGGVRVLAPGAERSAAPLVAAGQSLELRLMPDRRIAVEAPGVSLRGAWIALEPLAPPAHVLVKAPGTARLLRGRVRFTALDGILPLAELSLEEYLRGVVPAEMFPSWEAEALKAQAVLARTYTLAFQRRRHGDYDICDQVHCQVYLGIDNETYRTTRAVRETRGQVLTYREAPARIFYHSTCGGATAIPAAVFAEDLESTEDAPAPRVVSDLVLSGALCSKSPHFLWEYRLERKRFQRFLDSLAAGRSGVGTIRKLRILQRDETGRISRLELVGDGGTFPMSGNDFRLRFMGRFGRDTLKSTLFSIRMDGDSVFLEGRGYGHGVGLCQWGAQALAGRGYSYQAILQHYYPQSRLTSILKRSGA
jgi:stage II sporulation protein D